MTLIILISIIGCCFIYYFTKYSSLYGVIGSIISLVACAMYLDRYGVNIMIFIGSVIWFISLILWIAIYIRKN